MGDGPAWYGDPMFRGDAACGLVLRVAQVVETQGSCNEPRRVFDSAQSHERHKVAKTIFAPINLQMAKTVLTQAALDDVASVTSRTEIRFGLDGWTEARRSFHIGTAPADALWLRVATAETMQSHSPYP